MFKTLEFAAFVALATTNIDVPIAEKHVFVKPNTNKPKMKKFNKMKHSQTNRILNQPRSGKLGFRGKTRCGKTRSA